MIGRREIYAYFILLIQQVAGLFKEEDTRIWEWDKNAAFSVMSLYGVLSKEQVVMALETHEFITNFPHEKEIGTLYSFLGVFFVGRAYLRRA